MRTILLVFIPLIIFGCASSEKNSNQEHKYPDLVSLKTPENQKSEKSNIYIDTIKSITQNEKEVLLILGNFPDGCTHLKTATHSIRNDTLTIALEAWRNSDMMCAQVLTSFSYIYKKLPQAALNNNSSIVVNNRSYTIH